MKANATVVARGIAKADCDDAIKKCLLSLFNFELENTNVKSPQYKEKYREIIDVNVGNWSGANLSQQS
ncbi:MAG: hypothetical protein F2927_03560 [Actinobacteria bacterium]|uniref:Unannotated protein n=1 Tax=freshwater metagenome TaxID=449393 RepID=A0A6J7T9X3_9ZZZZ|nr:hypothetical protein [Actinomycetota bacterium]MTB15835.1 hypothetical protein [Actinomycetota bacterium]